MKGEELGRVVRDDEIMRMRIEENLSQREIAKIIGISHVMVGKIINRQIATSEENIRERRIVASEMIEKATKKAHDKYLDTGLASDAHAYAKLFDNYCRLWGLHAPSNTNINVRTDYSSHWEQHGQRGETFDVE